MNDFRIVQTAQIADTVTELCIKSNIYLRRFVKTALLRNRDDASNTELSKKILNILIKNYQLAQKSNAPLCQDTGVVNVFIDIGQKILLNGITLSNAIDRGVYKAYKGSRFRMSIVQNPLLRNNNFKNTPAMKYINIVSGNKIKITVLIKGGGSENATRLVLISPVSTMDDIYDTIIDTVKKTGARACPPYIIGAGIGGTSDDAILLSKKALFSPDRLSDFHKAEKARYIKKINALNIGPAGFGGHPTVLDIRLKFAPTHIATMPVGISIHCNSVRYATKKI